MIFFTLKTIFISLLLIALIHYLYGFFKNTLTVPKVKDLVNKPAQRYNQMFAGINNETDYTVQERDVNKDQQMKYIREKERNVGGQERTVGQQSMQAELKNFLNELKKPNMQPQMQTNTIQPTKDTNNNFPAANESAFGSYTPF